MKKKSHVQTKKKMHKMCFRLSACFVLMMKDSVNRQFCSPMSQKTKPFSLFYSLLYYFWDVYSYEGWNESIAHIYLNGVLKRDVIKMIFLKLWDLFKFFWGRPPKNLEGFVWSFLSITGLRSQRQFAPKCSFLASGPLGHCCFRISWQIP